MRRIKRLHRVALAAAMMMAGLSCAPEIAVAPPEVGTVLVQNAPERVLVGEQIALSAIVRDGAGVVLPSYPVIWSSSAPAIATVDSQGRLRGVSVGSVTVSASAGGKEGAVTVVVIPPVMTVAVSSSSASFVVGSTLQLTATPRDVSGAVLVGRSVGWTTSDATVATVSATGVVTASPYVGGATRTVTITATSESKSGTATLTVLPAPVETVTLNPVTATIPVGSTQSISPVVKDAAGNTLTGRTIGWTSSNPAVATVSPSAVVTAVAAGTTTVTAEVEGKSASVTVTVTLVPVESVSITPSAATVSVSRTQPFSVTLRDAAGNVIGGHPVTWASSNPAVASIASSGVATGNNVGTTTITATVGGKVATASLNVVAAVASIAVSPSVVSVAIGGTRALTATLRDAGGSTLSGRTVTWASGDTTVAVVSVAGVVTARSPGTTTVTATSDGVSGAATVTAMAGLVGGQTLTVGVPYVISAIGAPDYLVEAFVERTSAAPFRVRTSEGTGNVQLSLFAPGSAVTERPACFSERVDGSEELCSGAGRVGFWRVRVRGVGYPPFDFQTRVAADVSLVVEEGPAVLDRGSTVALPTIPAGGRVELWAPRTDASPFHVRLTGAGLRLALSAPDSAARFEGAGGIDAGAVCSYFNSFMWDDPTKLCASPGATGYWRIGIANSTTSSISGASVAHGEPVVLASNSLQSTGTIAFGDAADYVVSRSSTAPFSVATSGGAGDIAIRVYPPGVVVPFSSDSYVGLYCLSDVDGTNAELCGAANGSGPWRVLVESTSGNSSSQVLAQSLSPIAFGSNVAVPFTGYNAFREYWLERTTDVGFSVRITGTSGGDGFLTVWNPDQKANDTSVCSRSGSLSALSGTTCSLQGRSGFWRIRVRTNDRDGVTLTTLP